MRRSRRRFRRRVKRVPRGMKVTSWDGIVYRKFDYDFAVNYSAALGRG